MILLMKLVLDEHLSGDIWYMRRSWPTSLWIRFANSLS